MGSTSETYENETNLVVYVANENAPHLQPHQRHCQSQSHIVCENVRPIDVEDRAIAHYDICSGHEPSAVAPAPSYNITSQKAAVLFDTSNQNDNRDNCAINGKNICSSGNANAFGGENCYTANVGSVVFVNEKPNDPVVSFTNQETYVRSESVRSVDSVASSCSSLSSSSIGGNSKSLNHENFSASVNSPNEGLFTGKPTVAFPPYRVFPYLAKDMSNAFEKSAVSVPLGWKRMLNNGAVIYIRYVVFLVLSFLINPLTSLYLRDAVLTFVLIVRKKQHHEPILRNLYSPLECKQTFYTPNLS